MRRKTKTNTSLIAFMLFGFFCAKTVAYAQDAPVTLLHEDRISKAGIKTETAYRYRFVSGKLSTVGEKVSLREFDSDGKTTHLTTYKADGSLLKSVDFVYDDKGELIDTIDKTIAPGERRNLIHTYDADGRIIESIKRGPDGRARITVKLTYDDAGRVIETNTSTPPDIGVTIRTASTYDDGGRIAETSSYKNGDLLDRTTYGYDDQGRETEQISYDQAGDIVTRTAIGYDSDGKVAKLVVSNSNNVITSRTTYQYNQSGSLVKMVSSLPAANVSIRTALEYDDNDNVTEQRTYNKLDEPIDLTKYEYGYY